MATKNREAGDKSKGFVLQKQRAIHMIFDAIQRNENAQVLAAIEYEGDVFLYDGRIYKVEENKNYYSKNFSFNSGPVLNTMIYFLDYWMNNSKSKNIAFSFYATNKVAKERSSERIKRTGIIFPSEAILKLLSEKKYDTKNLINSCKTLICSEYKTQYNGKLKSSNHKAINALDD